MAIVTSLYLQHNGSLETLRRALTRNSDGTASAVLGRLLDLLADDCSYHAMMRADQQIDLPALRQAMIAKAADVALTLLGQPNRALSSRRELPFGSKGSLVVAIAGRKRRVWFDHESGIGGELINLIQRERGGDFPEAISCAQDIIGSAPIEPARSPRRILHRPVHRARMTGHGLAARWHFGPRGADHRHACGALP